MQKSFDCENPLQAGRQGLSHGNGMPGRGTTVEVRLLGNSALVGPSRTGESKSVRQPVGERWCVVPGNVLLTGEDRSFVVPPSGSVSG